MRKRSLTHILGIILIILLLVDRNIFAQDFSKYIFVVACTIVGISLDYKNLVGFVCFLFPLSCGIPSNYIFPIMAVLLLIKHPQNINWKQFILPMILVTYEIIISSIYGINEMANYIGYGANILILFFLIFDKDNNINPKLCLENFACGVLVLTVIIFMTSIGNYGLLALFTGRYRIGYTTDYDYLKNSSILLNTNANYLAYYSVVGISCILVLIAKTKKEIIAKTLMLVVITLVGFLTISQAYILVLFVVISVFVILSLDFSMKSLKLVFFIIVLVYSGYYFLYTYTSIITSVADRFRYFSFTESSGRWEIFLYYSNYILSHTEVFLFGTGALGTATITNNTLSIHNGLQQILVSYGIFGFLFITYQLIKSVKMSIWTKLRKTDYIYFLPLIAVVVFVQTIQFLNPYEIMMPFIIGIFSIKLRNYKNA